MTMLVGAHLLSFLAIVGLWIIRLTIWPLTVGYLLRLGHLPRDVRAPYYRMIGIGAFFILVMASTAIFGEGDWVTFMLWCCGVTFLMFGLAVLSDLDDLLEGRKTLS